MSANIFHYLSPVGQWQVEIVPEGVQRISLLPASNKEKTESPTLPARLLQLKKLLSDRLDAYFCGEKLSFLDIPIVLNNIPDFTHKVLMALRNIPYGQTVTYSTVASSINHPKAYRAVGQACRRNPLGLILPCHRVVASTGDLRGYFGSQDQGIVVKRFLLNLENTTTAH